MTSLVEYAKIKQFPPNSKLHLYGVAGFLDSSYSVCTIFTDRRKIPR